MAETIAYIGIGNSDSNLTNAEWAEFHYQLELLLEPRAGFVSNVYGAWHSHPAKPWQNACWCIQIPTDECVVELKRALSRLAKHFYQESIIFAIADVEFIEPV